MNEKTEHTDMFDRPINVGDYIVYSAIDGQSATLRAGQVLELRFVKSEYDATKKPVAKILVKSWNNFKSDGWAKSPSGRQKNVTLSFLTRVVVVAPETVSDKVRSDLDGPVHDWRGQPIK